MGAHEGCFPVFPMGVAGFTTSLGVGLSSTDAVVTEGPGQIWKVLKGFSGVEREWGAPKRVPPGEGDCSACSLVSMCEAWALPWGRAWEPGPGEGLT